MIRRTLAILFVAAACVGALVLTGADDEGVLKTYKIEFDSAFGLVEGGDLKIGGVKAGATTDFELQRKPPYRVIVTAEVTEPGFDALLTDASCEVRQQSLIGEYFVDCDLGRDGEPLPEDKPLPVKRTSGTIPLDLINNIMRRPYRERWRLILAELGTGLAGRPKELNEVIRRAHPGLRETTETIKILADQNRTIRDFIENQDKISQEVEPVREDFAKWARESRDTAVIQNSRREDLGRYWNRLSVFLDELEPTLAQLDRTAKRQIPTLRQLEAAAPDLTRFLTSLEGFARESRPATAALGGVANTGTQAIRESREEIDELRQLAAFTPRLGKPLRQFLQSIDDRNRSYENDPEAGVRAPPAPDKTAYKEGQGYTGMENLLNYIYWQTLGINGFDELGHLLRIVAFVGGPCTGYSAQPTQSTIDRCNSWIGPFQPGVDPVDADPTRSPAAAARLRKQAVANERKADAGEVSKEGPGGLIRPPKPGERDLSKPQPALLPGVQELIDSLSQLSGGGATGAAPGVDAQEALLDYLLTR